MKYKFELLEQLKANGIVAVIRAENRRQALKIVDFAYQGGIKAIEITMTITGAIDVIKDISSKFSPEMLIGAGTILDSETARLAILAGAEFIVSPHLDIEIIRTANRYQKVVIPGAMTVREVILSMEHGADVVKIFPSGLFGPEIIKAIKGPLPQAPLMPTGGINLNNLQEWFKAGVFCVGVGSSLTKDAIKKGDYAIVKDKAQEFINKYKEIKEQIENS